MLWPSGCSQPSCGPFELSIGAFPITASIGITCDGPRHFDAGGYELLREADSAICRPKKRSLGHVLREDSRHHFARARDTSR